MAGRGVICAVYGCFNYKRQSDRKSFYRFPRNEALCTQWVVNSRRADLDEILKTKGPEHLNKCYVVCSDHFSEKDFRNKNLLSQGIWPGAVPSVLHHNAKETNLRGIRKKREREDVSTPEISDELPVPVPTESAVQEDNIMPAEERVNKPTNKPVPTESAVQEDNIMPAEERVNKCCSNLMLKYRKSQKLLSKYRSLNKRLRRQLDLVRKNQSKCNCEKRVVDLSVAQNFINYLLKQGNCKGQDRRH